MRGQQQLGVARGEKMKPQIHVCARCGKEMSYTDKRMVYLYRCREYGKMEPVAHVDLCKDHARELWMWIKSKYAKGAKE